MDNALWAIWAFFLARCGLAAVAQYAYDEPAFGKWFGRVFLAGAVLALAASHPSIR